MAKPTKVLMISRAQFERRLKNFGFTDTGVVSPTGKSKLWRRVDGLPLSISVHASYPEYMLFKIMKEGGFPNLPLYDSNA